MDEQDEFNEVASDEEQSWGDKMLIPGHPLRPRHKKLAELAAAGRTNNEIAKDLSYTPSRVSILLSNSLIKQEIERIRDRIYEDTKKRLKDLTGPALDEIERCLTDGTNRYKENLKVETARWLIEKVDGRAVQSIELGQNTLASLMDRLDALKSSGQTSALPEVERPPTAIEGEFREVTEQVTPKSEEDLLSDWVLNFNSAKK